jgi:hypothetical protein
MTTRNELTAAYMTEDEKKKSNKKALEGLLASMLQRDDQSGSKWQLVTNKIIFYKNPELN